MKFIKTTLAVLSLALAASIATSQATAQTEEELRETAIQKLRDLRDDLALTPEQKTRIRAVVIQHKDSLRSQWQQGKSAREAMRKAASDHGPESDEAKAAASVIGDAARDRSLLVAKIATEVKPILSAEQLRKFEQARGKFESLIESKLNAGG